MPVGLEFTPTLPVKKEGGQDYRPVGPQTGQPSPYDSTSRHSNSYTLLSLLPLSAKIYTYLNIKITLPVYASPGVSTLFLLLNGKTQKGHKRSTYLDWLPTSLRIPQRSLGKPWLLTWIHSSQVQMLVATLCGRLAFGCREQREDSWEGTKALLELLMESGCSLEKEATDHQKRRQDIWVCSERRHKAVRPVQKRGHLRIPQPTRQQMRSSYRLPGFTKFGCGLFPDGPGII